MSSAIAIYSPDLSTGGVGKMRMHLISEMARRGLAVDLLLSDTNSPLLRQAPEGVRVVRLGTTHAYFSLPALYHYFRRAAPKVLLTDRLRLNIACHRACALARCRSRIYLSVHNPITVKLAGLPTSKAAALKAQLLTWAPRNARIIAVSQGVADDLVQGLGLDATQIQVVYNPVITDRLAALAAEPVDHPFFAVDGWPVILSAGRMTAQKDFPTLLRAFRRVRDQRPARLLILGKHGRDYQALRTLIGDLGLAEDVAMPGFDANPYRYMARASVYVLSSRWEGFGNVMVEAMATGLPVVATDCPVGPAEILQGGVLGPLVPIGDADAMARAIISVLDAPPDRRRLREGGSLYTLERSVAGYLDSFGLS